MALFSRLFSFEADPLKTYGKELTQVNAQKDEVAELTQEQMQTEIQQFREELKKAETNEQIFRKLLEIRPRVFALTREAASRTIGQFHYDVQIVGGAVLSEGKIAEMRTGEGKTLTATLPLVLFALAGKGAHLVTVNDYLARWQASLMGPIFHYLGLSVASIQHEASFRYDPTYQPEAEEIERLQQETEGLVMDVKHMRPVTRREAYGADITYGTNNEFGFDYLRDNMVQNINQLVQRDLFFTIVDEVDSILIDEARTPLIISQPDTDPTSKYYEFAKIVDQLQDEVDFKVEEKHKAASLTDDGITKIEKILRVPNIYDTSKGVTTLHHIEQALRAKTLFKRDRDYVVRDGEIIIVDEFTGRLMFGRRYSEGLHQAIEAKENVEIQQESKTLATITFQNLFRLYARLSGMTGTAKTEEEEFFKIYKLEVVTIPTNQPMIRDDMQDVVYKSEEAKFKAIARDIKERNKKGQPILIGTVSIAKNELLADYLKKEGVKFEVLNAKNHEREAHIIAQAGRPRAVTLATNIAGRGVDILLGGNPVDAEEARLVREAGGLHILGTERHESRRIDNQLRGRAGRQGDPGSSQFFVSMEDDLMRLFGGERMKGIMERLGIPDDQPVEAGLVSRSIEQAQRKIEGMNFDTRKRVLEYDDVLNLQRIKIYTMRRQFLSGQTSTDQDLKEQFLTMIEDEINNIVTNIFATQQNQEEAVKAVTEAVSGIFPVTNDIAQRVKDAASNAASREFAVSDALNEAAKDLFEAKEREIGKEMYEQIIRFVALQAIDGLWMEHLDTMNNLRDSVSLRGYGQRDPLVEYKKEGYVMFQRLQNEINRQIVYTILKVGVQVQQHEDHQHHNLVTNLSDGSTGQSATAASSDPQLAGVGRNDSCPCGSGKKYKKCGLLNTQEHQQLMNKKV
jgi:preprotein translocase subunit SecA